MNGKITKVKQPQDQSNSKMGDNLAVADPGFPMGGINSRGGYVLKILYVEMKEYGPLGGMCLACPLDLPMFRIHTFCLFQWQKY